MIERSAYQNRKRARLFSLLNQLVASESQRSSGTRLHGQRDLLPLRDHDDRPVAPILRMTALPTSGNDLPTMSRNESLQLVGLERAIRQGKRWIEIRNASDAHKNGGTCFSTTGRDCVAFTGRPLARVGAQTVWAKSSKLSSYRRVFG